MNRVWLQAFQEISERVRGVFRKFCLENLNFQDQRVNIVDFLIFLRF
jgi:hypothetical protein